VPGIGAQITIASAPLRFWGENVNFLLKRRVMHRRRSDENGSTNSSEAERRLCVTRVSFNGHGIPLPRWHIPGISGAAG